MALTANSLLPADTQLDFELLFRHECGGEWIWQITFSVGLAPHATYSWERWQSYASCYFGAKEVERTLDSCSFSGCGEMVIKGLLSPADCLDNVSN